MDRKTLIVIAIAISGSLFAAYLYLTSGSEDEITIMGAVMDAKSGTPVSGAIIETEGLMATTAPDGTFSITVEASTESLAISKEGYKTERASVDPETLEPMTIKLEPSTTPPGSPDARDWGSVDDFAYLLQDIDLEALGETLFDLVIIDYSSEGDEETRFTHEEIQGLKESPGGPKLVLAYMSIGEAEDYRWYWEEPWDADGDGEPDPGAPIWLGPSNPEWPGNYKVRYWEEDWKALIYGAPTSYLDKIIYAGFDGVYMDIVDAYEYWGPDGESGLELASAEGEMIALVREIAEYARTAGGGEDFGVFPQNGEALVGDPGYLEAITGIGKEDTWFDGNSHQPGEYTEEVVGFLDAVRDAGKLVLVVDYPTRRALVDEFYSEALKEGYVPYATVRDLDEIVVSPGHRPD